MVVEKFEFGVLYRGAIPKETVSAYTKHVDELRKNTDAWWLPAFNNVIKSTSRVRKAWLQHPVGPSKHQILEEDYSPFNPDAYLLGETETAENEEPCYGSLAVASLVSLSEYIDEVTQTPSANRFLQVFPAGDKTAVHNDRNETSRTVGIEGRGIFRVHRTDDKSHVYGNVPIGPGDVFHYSGDVWHSAINASAHDRRITLNLIDLAS